MVLKQIFPRVNCDIDLGDVTLSQGNDTIVWYFIKIQHGIEEFWPGLYSGMCALWPWPWRYDLGARSWHTLDIGDMTVCQDHDTPLGHEQQLCEILSRSKSAVRSYGPDTDFWYMCIVTLT